MNKTQKQLLKNIERTLTDNTKRLLKYSDKIYSDDKDEKFIAQISILILMGQIKLLEELDSDKMMEAL